MAGLVQAYTFSQFADAARRGALTPAAPPPNAPATPGKPSPIPAPLGKILGQIMVSDVKSRFSTGTDPRGNRWLPLAHPRPNGGDKPLRDTGVLMASFTARTYPDAVAVGTTHPGAALQNFGGTVTGKGKMLAIPLTKEAKRSGGPRRWKGRPLKFQPTRKRRVFLLVEERSPGVRVGQFLLVDSVTVPQREFMGISSRAWEQIADAVSEATTRGWLERKA